MSSWASPVAITAVGLCLPGADSLDEFFARLRGRRPQFVSDRASGFRVGRAQPAGVEELEPEIPQRYFSGHPRDVQLYLSALIRVYRAAGQAAPLGSRVSVHDGTSRGPFLEWAHDGEGTRGADEADLAGSALGQAASFGAIALGAEGLVETLNASCCSGLAALRSALRELESHQSDVALAGGHEACLGSAYLSTYHAAGLLREGTFDAYDGDNGTVFSEGAVVYRLERLTKGGGAESGAPVLGEIHHVRLENHAQHPTNVERRDAGLAPLIQRALGDAGVRPSDVGVVVGHGNGVRVCDALEKRSLELVFDEPPLLVSNKPVVGHTIGASGAVNVAHALLPEFAENRERPFVLCLSVGIGGHQAAVLVRPRGGRLG